MTTTDPADETAAREIRVSRVFDAPRELVFEAWTEPRHLAQWWGPKGFTTTTQAIDVRPGGAWRFVMHGPDGVDYPNLIVFDEIVSPERLVYTQGSGAADDAGQFKVTVTFAEHGRQTRLSLRMLFATAAARDRVVEEFGAIEGAHQTLDRLEAHLAQLP